MQQALPLDGHCNGPLFAPVSARRPAKVRGSGGKEVWAKYRRAKPRWVRWKDCNVYWEMSVMTTIATGVQHSVDHIVPLQHPLVCGLHCPANLRVATLRENISKGNNWWPDMWGQQEALFNGTTDDSEFQGRSGGTDVT